MQYTTPGPAALTVRFASGDLRIEATDRPDVEIDVEPHGSSSADRELADATVVEQVGNEIRIIAPDSKGWLRRSASLRVRASVPTGTATRIAVESADVVLTGTLGALDITTASGDVAAERAVVVRARRGECRRRLPPRRRRRLGQDGVGRRAPRSRRR